MLQGAGLCAQWGGFLIDDGQDRLQTESLRGLVNHSNGLLRLGMSVLPRLQLFWRCILSHAAQGQLKVANAWAVDQSHDAIESDLLR